MKKKKMYLLVRMSDGQETKIYADCLVNLMVEFTSILISAESAGLNVYPEMFDRILVGYNNETDL